MNEIPNTVESLYDFYTWLDTEDLQILSSQTYSRLFENMRDKFENDSPEKQKIQYEIEVLSCNIKENKLHYHVVFVENGLEKVWPAHEKFPEEQIDYIIERLDFCKNMFLKSYYNHFIWLKRRNISFAHNSIELYMTLLQDTIVLEQNDNSAYILTLLKNAYLLSISINYKTDNIKDLIRKVLFEYSYEYNGSSSVRIGIIRLMFDNKKHFKSVDFKDVPLLCIKIAKALSKEEHIHFADKFFVIGQKIAQKYNIDMGFLWFEAMGANWEIMINLAKSSSGLAGINYCQNAISYYKKSGNETKVQEITEQLKKFKANIPMQSFSYDIDTKYIEQIDKDVGNMLKDTADNIVASLIFSDNIIPSIKEKNQDDGFSFSSIASTIILDSYGNSIKNYTTYEEKENERKRQDFEIQLKHEMMYINRLIYKAIVSEKLTAEIILKFLNKNSWLGKTYSKNLTNTKLLKYNWLDLIAPSIHDFFMQIKQAHLSNYKIRPNFVLSVDSLSLKFEGLLRDFCQVLGVDIIELKKDKEGRNIEKHKDINTLLRDEKLNNFLGESESLLLKIILIDNHGWNIRNKVAHTLMVYEEYSFEQFNLMLLALLRIAKYEFKYQ